MVCEHETTKATKRKISDGRMVVWLQCQNCGSGRAGKNSDFKMDELPDFDESIRDRYNLEDRRQREEKYKTFQEELQNKTAEWFQKYNEYLASPHWKMVRRAVVNRDRTCQSCFSNLSTIAHHLSYATYSRSGFSFPHECVGVCAACHQKLHPEKDLND